MVDKAKPVNKLAAMFEMSQSGVNTGSASAAEEKPKPKAATKKLTTNPFE